MKNTTVGVPRTLPLADALCLQQAKGIQQVLYNMCCIICTVHSVV